MEHKKVETYGFPDGEAALVIIARRESEGRVMRLAIGIRLVPS